MNAIRDAIQKIVTLRILVGFLGEKRQANWWDCGFLDATGTRFLKPTFPRTFLSAAVRSTTEAARLVHDSRIGRVGIFHLFRLPVEIENQLESRVPEIAFATMSGMGLSRDSALEELGRFSKSRLVAPLGPVQIGIPEKILTPTSIYELAAHYHSALMKGSQCFPYFAPTSNVKR